MKTALGKFAAVTAVLTVAALISMMAVVEMAFARRPQPITR
jgi:hypothetical protein